MTATALRKRIVKKINQLKNDELKAADYFISYLSDTRYNEATKELLEIPGFKKRFERAMKEYAKGEWVDFDDIKRNV